MERTPHPISLVLCASLFAGLLALAGVAWAGKPEAPAPREPEGYEYRMETEETEEAEETEETEAPEAPTPPIPPTPVVAPSPVGSIPRVARLSKGWIGVGLRCGDCTVVTVDSLSNWVFEDLPEISYVEPGSPAAHAGLQRDDVITHIDGISLLTAEGGRRFARLRPGRAVKLSLVRESGKHVLAVVPAARRDPAAVYSRSLSRVREQLQQLKQKELTHTSEQMRRDLARMEAELARVAREEERRSDPQRLRWSGVVGSSEVVVRGLGSVVVSTDPSTGEVIITTSDATVRVSPEKKKRKP